MILVGLVLLTVLGCQEGTAPSTEVGHQVPDGYYDLSAQAITHSDTARLHATVKLGSTSDSTQSGSFRLHDPPQAVPRPYAGKLAEASIESRVLTFQLGSPALAGNFEFDPEEDQLLEGHLTARAFGEETKWPASMSFIRHDLTGLYTFELYYQLNSGEKHGRYLGRLHVTDIGLDSLRLTGRLERFERDSARSAPYVRIRDSVDVNSAVKLAEDGEFSFALPLGQLGTDVDCTGTAVSRTTLRGDCVFGSRSTSRIGFKASRLPKGWRFQDLGLSSRDTLYEIAAVGWRNPYALAAAARPVLDLLAYWFFESDVPTGSFYVLPVLGGISEPQRVRQLRSIRYIVRSDGSGHILSSRNGLYFLDDSTSVPQMIGHTNQYSEDIRPSAIQLNEYGGSVVGYDEQRIFQIRGDSASEINVTIDESVGNDFYIDYAAPINDGSGVWAIIKTVSERDTTQRRLFSGIYAEGQWSVTELDMSGLYNVSQRILSTPTRFSEERLVDRMRVCGDPIKPYTRLTEETCSDGSRQTITVWLTREGSVEYELGAESLPTIIHRGRDGNMYGRTLDAAFRLDETLAVQDTLLTFSSFGSESSGASSIRWIRAAQDHQIMVYLGNNFLVECEDEDCAYK